MTFHFLRRLNFAEFEFFSEFRGSPGPTYTAIVVVLVPATALRLGINGCPLALGLLL